MAAKKSLSNILVWILMAMLILGLGGFGITNLSGANRSVATVGEETVDINAYARGLQNSIRAAEAQQGAPMTFAQAQVAGIDRSVMGQLLNAALLDHETTRLGISVGDTVVGQEIIATPAFAGVNGKFDRQTYKFALENMGLKEAQFEQTIRKETARTLLQGAVVSGTLLPDAYANTLLAYSGEARDVTWALLDRDALETGLPEPTDDEIKAFYDAHPDLFTAPETRKITYVWLTPDMIIDTVEIDQEALREAYEGRIDEYKKPERRLLERLVFPDAKAAEAAKKSLEDGSKFEDLVSARGLEMADVDLGDVAKDELGAEADAVFAAQNGDVVGPVETDLGPALFKVNAILTAQETSFEDAQPELRDELARDRAARVIESQMDTIDDELAGGATLEDLARDTDMELGQIDWDPSIQEDIAGYEAFRSAARAIKEDDYPKVLDLDDDGLFALRLDEIVPSALRPLADVREQVIEAWTQDTLTKELDTQAAAYVERLQAGESFADLGLITESAGAVTRTDPLGDDFPGASEALFDMQPDGYTHIAADGRALILHLTKITPANLSEDDNKFGKEALLQQGGTMVANDLLQALINTVRTRTEITVNQGAINAVNTNFR